ASASAGFRVVREAQTDNTSSVNTEDITMENMEVVGESLTHDNQVTVERDGVRVTFSRDARGYFKTCVEGERSKAELKQIGEELAGLVIQNYVHRRLAQELENQGFLTMNEEQTADNSIHMHERRM